MTTPEIWPDSDAPPWASDLADIMPPECWEPDDCLDVQCWDAGDADISMSVALGSLIEMHVEGGDYTVSATLFDSEHAQIATVLRRMRAALDVAAVAESGRMEAE